MGFMLNVVAIASLVALVVVCLLPHLHPNSAEPQPVPNMSLGQGVGSISGWAKAGVHGLIGGTQVCAGSKNCHKGRDATFLRAGTRGGGAGAVGFGFNNISRSTK